MQDNYKSTQTIDEQITNNSSKVSAEIKNVLDDDKKADKEGAFKKLADFIQARADTIKPALMNFLSQHSDIISAIVSNIMSAMH